MTHSSEDSAIVNGGVAFTVTTLDFSRHPCIISAEALLSLAKLKSRNFGTLEIFHANEARIRGVARRMIAARVKGSPLRIEAHSFR
jgi:hypothetical protein